MDQYLPQFKTCLQKEPSFCVTACPFRLDVLDFIEKFSRGAMDGAYKTYRNAVGFPAIVSTLCPEHCRDVCPLEQSIQLGALEKACVRFAKKTEPPEYNLPLKKAKIAIVGMGLSGLGCLLRLATKKYQVTIYEKSEKPGGKLWDLMDPAVFLEDIERQLRHETYQAEYNREIVSSDELAGFDAVYVATGSGGNDFGLLANAGESPCLMIGETGVFGGGSLLGSSPMESLADGLQMGTTIDNFLKTGILQRTPPRAATTMVLDPSRLEGQLAYQPVPADGFSMDEAIWESKRCIRCQCDACRIYCDLTAYYNRWPLRIRDEIAATTLPGSSEVKSTPAKRLINTCTQCGLCKETCPKEIDLGGLILAARRNLHRQEKLPWAFHEFWINDMLFSNGDQAFLAKMPPGTGNAGSSAGKAGAAYAFFPGCQLGASDPTLVVKTYKYLLKHQPSTGLILSCCGVPAKWGGDEDNAEKAAHQILDAWTSMGKPTLVVACPTCRNFFESQLPQIPLVFLYDLMGEWGVEKSAGSGFGRMSVFDPCAVEQGNPVRSSVRKIVDSLGIEMVKLPLQEAHGACCSYGGQVSIANPDFAKKVIEKRIGESPDPYIAYCINCRDAFLSEGKETYHLLDLLFDRKPSLATVSQRRKNRQQLKKSLLRELWGEEMKEAMEGPVGFNLKISPDLDKKLSRANILEEDMVEVVQFCLRTGRTVWNPETGTYSGYKMVGHGTYWAEYRPMDDENRVIELVNGYCHRIQIDLEGVWNGNKIEIDV